MKRNLVWLPFFGVFFTEHNPFIEFFEPWVIYQITTTVIVTGVSLILLVQNIF